MRKQPTAGMRHAFEEFIGEIPQLLRELQDALSLSRSYRHVRVEYDFDTLERVEAFYLDVLAGNESVDVPQDRLDRMYAAYIGEAQLNYVDGEWVLGNDDFTFGEPSVTGEGLITVSPMRRIRLQKDSREPFLRSWIEFSINKEEFERELFEGLDDDE